MRQRQAELDATGVRVYAVSFETPARLRAYVRRHHVPFPVLADPRRVAYSRYGMLRGPWWRIYSPRVLWRYAQAYARGERVHIQGDTLQRGGDFLIDGAGRLRFAHVGADSFDRPPLDDLIAGVQALR